jgi:hypothetical protein
MIFYAAGGPCACVQGFSELAQAQPRTKLPYREGQFGILEIISHLFAHEIDSTQSEGAFSQIVQKSSCVISSSHASRHYKYWSHTY